jgi:hypothetical protein
MNFKKVLLVTTLGMSVSLARSQIIDNSAPESDLYSANEFSVDLYGFGASRDKSGGSSNGWGPGVGANYFFTRNLGVGLDNYTDAFHWPDKLNLSGIFRYPIPDSRFAAYGFGGGGRQWSNAAQWTAHVGAGVEYRFRSNAGFFSDIRQVFPGETRNYTVVRFGFRLNFR